MTVNVVLRIWEFSLVFCIALFLGFVFGRHLTEKALADRWYRHCMELHNDASFCNYELGYQLGVERHK